MAKLGFVLLCTIVVGWADAKRVTQSEVELEDLSENEQFADDVIEKGEDLADELSENARFQEEVKAEETRSAESVKVDVDVLEHLTNQVAEESDAEVQPDPKKGPRHHHPAPRGSGRPAQITAAIKDFKTLLAIRPLKKAKILRLKRKSASWAEKKQALDEQVAWNKLAIPVEHKLEQLGLFGSKLRIDDETLGYVKQKPMSPADFTKLAGKLPPPLNGAEAEYLLERIRKVPDSARTSIPRATRQAIFNGLPKKLQATTRGTLALAGQH